MSSQAYTRRIVTRSTLGGLTLLALAACATAPVEFTSEGEPIAYETPYSLQDESWVSLDGHVVLVRSDRFVLDYGQGTIAVEMDGRATVEAEGASGLRPDDRVVVIGRIDSDLLEETTIEAQSVHVARTGSKFYASPRDDEVLTLDHGFWPLVVEPSDYSRVVATGVVTNAGQDSFTLRTAAGPIHIDVSSMRTNPIADDPFQRVRLGDRVSVTGQLNYLFFEQRELAAQSVTVLEEASEVRR